MRVIAVANQKGGCGKTTTAINLASFLVHNGKRALLIDVDPQSHATMGLNFKPEELERTMYHVLTPESSERCTLEHVIHPVRENFDLAPASVILSAVEQQLSGVPGREEGLMRAIGQMTSPYDYVIVDCPPSIGLLSFNALRAAAEVIIPIEMSLFSLNGVAKLAEAIQLLGEKANHYVRTRALLTMYDARTRYSRRVFEKVKEQFDSNTFDTVIHYNIRMREAADYGLPIAEYDKRSAGFRDYEALALEVMKKEGVRPSAEQIGEEVGELFSQTERYINDTMDAPVPDILAEEQEGS